MLCFHTYNNSPEEDWHVCIPSSLISPIIRWCHLVLGHVGATQLYDATRRRFHYPSLKQRCEQFKCADCQKNKQWGPGYGMLPPQNAPLMPWNEAAVDLIGPWAIELQNGQTVEFNALTCIDPVANLVELTGKQQNMWLRSLKIVGYPDILDPIGAFMTMVENLLVRRFR